MKKSDMIAVSALGAVAALAVILGAHAKGQAEGNTDVSSNTSEASVVTNDNGSVSRTFTECNVSTNGNMVTEHRRETRTTLDGDGNVIETATSEYAQSYTVGQDIQSLTGVSAAPAADAGTEKATSAETADSFLGLKYGEEFASTNFVKDADEPTLLCATFVPKKPLAGFDDYYVYVTPKTHRIAKVYACAKAPVDPGVRGRRHYLLEALERRYHTWARLCSYWQPWYRFDVGNNRYVMACLAGATRDYATILLGWDNNELVTAANEAEELREAARKAAAEKRNRRVTDAAAAF